MKKDEKDESNTSDDIEFEATDDEGIVSKNKVSKLKKKLARCQEEKQEYLDGWQRSQAELVNLRKKDAEKLSQAVKVANRDLIEDLLPTLDSFNAAMQNKEAWEKVDSNWRVGIEYIYTNLVNTLENEGLKEVQYEKFDEQLHEAVQTVSAEDRQSGDIITVVQSP